MRYNVHAGHNPAGKIACGAVGLLDESKENRLIADEIMRLLRLSGNTVYDCTVDNGTSQNDVLKKIVTKCNSHTVDFDFSIHLNSGRSDKTGDGKIGGFEVWVSSTNKGKGEVAERIRKNMKSLGFTDRGTKTTSSLYVLNKTVAPALLLEVCFVDDKDDYNLYKKAGYKAVAKAIAEGIVGKTISEKVEIPKTETKTQSTNTTNTMLYYKAFNSKSIVDGLKSIGVNSGFTNRLKIAKANGIKFYTGTAAQNEKLLTLAKQGKLKKA